MQNRVKYFLRRIVYNSHLNRTRFAIDRQRYTTQKNPIIRRHFGTQTSPGSDNDPNRYALAIAIAFASYFGVNILDT